MAIGIVCGLFFATMFIMNFEGSDGKESIDFELDLDSDIVSTDPKISAANFIKFNGTFGDLDSLKEEDIVKMNFESNSDMRRTAFEKVKGAIIPDSPIITGNEEATIDDDLAQFPAFYSIINMRVSEPYNSTTFTINHNQIGQVDYEAVKVNVDFDSTQTVFYWPTDASSDGIITKEVASDSFEDIEVTLVKSGDLWFIYDVEDIEYTLNIRMSTWSGRGEYNVSHEQEVVEEYTMGDIR